MTKARALYICPVTEAAIVAAAPVIATGRDYEVVKAVLLEGLEDRDNPTEGERSRVVRPGRGIAHYLLRRGVDTIFAAGSAFDVALWREAIGEVLTTERLDGIDVIVVNAQAGTKQMSYGAWEGLAQPRARGVNLATRKCFIKPGRSIRVQTDAVDSGMAESDIEHLSLADYLMLYGFQVIDDTAGSLEEDWLWQHRKLITDLWRRVIAGHYKRADGLANRLASDASAASLGKLGRPDHWLKSFWLEAGLYVRLRERAEGTAAPATVSSPRCLFDWAMRGEQPVADPTQQESDHEFDGAVLSTGVLHLFECKNDKRNGITQDMLHKQVALGKRLHGGAGVNAIVTPYQPGPKSPLWPKAEAQNVQIVIPDGSDMETCLTHIFGSPAAR